MRPVRKGKIRRLTRIAVVAIQRARPRAWRVLAVVSDGFLAVRRVAVGTVGWNIGARFVRTRGRGARMTIDRTIARRAPSPYLPRSEAKIIPAEGAESPGSLRIHMLSTFRVMVNDVELNGRLNGKARTLLKILAAQRRVLPRDALMEMVWPETDPTTGPISLKVAAHNLRTALEPTKPSGTPSTWIVFR